MTANGIIANGLVAGGISDTGTRKTDPMSPLAG